MATKRITNQQASFLASELASRDDPRRQKVALEELSRLYRTNHRLAPEAAPRIEQQIVGLINMSRDACYTESVARACAKHVRVVVGSTEAINDETAPKFTYAFYQALANGRPYENAFRAGQVEVRTVSMEAAACYKLFTR